MSLSNRKPHARRRRSAALAIAAVLAGAVLMAPAAARADSGYGYCQAAGCNGKDPVDQNCQVNAYPVRSYTLTYPGTSQTYEVELIYSPDCQANWARVISSTAVRFCVNEFYSGATKSYISAPGLPSWTNMVNGGPGTHDTAYLDLPHPTEPGGLTVIYADDAGYSGEDTYSPC